MMVERKNNRGKMEIYFSILSECTEGIKKTHIMQKSNLNFEQVIYYLGRLTELGMIASIIADGGVMYRTTEKGRIYISNYCSLIELVQEPKDGEISRDCNNGLNERVRESIFSPVVEKLQEVYGRGFADSDICRI